jgi:hypothetical protein
MIFAAGVIQDLMLPAAKFVSGSALYRVGAKPP